MSWDPWESMSVVCDAPGDVKRGEGGYSMQGSGRVGKKGVCRVARWL